MEMTLGCSLADRVLELTEVHVMTVYGKLNTESVSYAVRNILYIRTVWVRNKGSLPGFEWSSNFC